jgi:hypothetical protein
VAIEFHSGIERGCGRRIEGGIYAETGTSTTGKPVEAFLFDPVIPVDDPPSHGFSPVGVHPIEGVNGIWNAGDWVGETHYAYPADYVEEVRRFGSSRRLPRTFDFSTISAKSRLVFMHSRAVIQNYQALAQERPEYTQVARQPWCPQNKPHHQHPGQAEPSVRQQCAALHWETFDPAGKDIDLANDPDLDARAAFRVFKGLWEYRCAVAPRPQRYSPGLFMWLPIHRLVVIRDPYGDTHKEALEAAQKAQVPLDMEDA